MAWPAVAEAPELAILASSRILVVDVNIDSADSLAMG